MKLLKIIKKEYIAQYQMKNKKIFFEFFFFFFVFTGKSIQLLFERLKSLNYNNFWLLALISKLILGFFFFYFTLEMVKGNDVIATKILNSFFFYFAAKYLGNSVKYFFAWQVVCSCFPRDLFPNSHQINRVS